MISPAALDENPAQAIHRLEQLNEIARLLASFASVEETFDAVFVAAAEAIDITTAVLIEDQEGIRKTAFWTRPGRDPELAQGATEHAQTAFFWLSDKVSPADAIGPKENRQYIVLPLAVAGRGLFGVLQAESDAFDKQDLVFINAIASQFAVALDRDHAWRRDIVRRQAAETMELTLREQADALSAADRQRSEFLSGLANELRASLAASREIQQAVRRVPGSEGIDRALPALGQQIRHTAQLIDDLNALSVLTREQIRINKARVEFVGILSRAAERGNERLRDMGQTLTVTLPAGPAWIEADPTRIEQVLEMLIDKMSLLVSPGGRIWLTARFSSDAHEDTLLPGGAEGPQIIVTLRDEGATGTKPFLPRVFDLMSPGGRELDPTDVQLLAGMKLLHRIVQLHGGSVMATSSGAGLGSEFEVRLPIGGRQAEVLRPERRSS